MLYEDALREWGRRKLVEDARRHHEFGFSRSTGPFREPVIDPSTVLVEMNFDEGWSCCGGNDEGCYCSQATSPVAQVKIQGREYDQIFYTTIEADDFDFVTVLGEILEAGGGVLTAPPPPSLPEIEF